MYTPPLEAPTVRPTSPSSFEKNRDNGFNDLLREKYATDRDNQPRTDEPRTRDPRPEESRSEETRPRESRTDAREETRDPRPKTETHATETRTDENTPPKDATEKDAPAASESDRDSARQDDASEPETANASPTTAPAANAETQATEPGHTTQTFTDGVPDYQQIVESAANTPAAATTTDLADALGKGTTVPETPDLAGTAGATSIDPATTEGAAVSGQPATVTADTSANQQNTGSAIAAAQSTPQTQVAGVADGTVSASNNAAATENTAASPLAAVAAKAGAATRDAAGSATATPVTNTAATPGTAADDGATSSAPAVADAGGDFDAMLNAAQTSQGAKQGAGQSGAGQIPSAGNPDAGATAGKAADMLSAAGDALPRAPESLPQATAPNSAQTSPQTMAFGSELRVVSDASPLAETAAARNLPNAAANQLAVQINRAVVDGQEKIVINLKPGTLGRVSVNLEVGHDNRLIAVIAVEKPETLDLLQRDARTLERALQEAGIKTDSGSLSFNLQGQGADDFASDDFPNDGPYAALPHSDEDAGGPIAASTTAYAADASGVDIHV